MHNFPLHKRFYYRYLGLVYGFTHWTNRLRLLGFRLSSLVKLAAFIPLFWFWRKNSGDWAIGLGLALGLAVLWLYWRARRVGYMKFVGGETAVPPDDLNPLPPNQRIALTASGVFGVSNQEERHLLVPAEHWRTPLGDHTVMIQPQPGRFLYQFFNGTTLQTIQKGFLIHGLTFHKVLALTFLSSWGEEQLSLRGLVQSEDAIGKNGKQRTIYLRFENADVERAVWHTIVHDAREKRKT